MIINHSAAVEGPLRFNSAFASHLRNRARFPTAGRSEGFCSNASIIESRCGRIFAKFFIDRSRLLIAEWFENSFAFNGNLSVSISKHTRAKKFQRCHISLPRRLFRCIYSLCRVPPIRSSFYSAFALRVKVLPNRNPHTFTFPRAVIMMFGGFDSR